MSKPIVEPAFPRTQNRQGYDTRQLQRRPPPFMDIPVILGLSWIRVVWQPTLPSVAAWTDIPFDFEDDGALVCIHDVDPDTGFTPDPATGGDPGDVFRSFELDYTTGAISLNAPADGLIRHNLWVNFDGVTQNYNRGIRFTTPFIGDGNYGRESMMSSSDVLVVDSEVQWSTVTVDGFRLATASDASGTWQPQYHQTSGSDVTSTVVFVLVAQTNMGGIWCNSA